MVNLKSVTASNSRLSSVRTGPYVALFVGATSGIGLETLKQFAQHAAEPRVYFVARSATKAAPIADELRRLNPRGTYEIIEKDVSLVKQATQVAEYVKAKESSLDLLFLSVGFFSLDGRQGKYYYSQEIYNTCLARYEVKFCMLTNPIHVDTAEGLDASLATRYYSRARIMQLLLPLLNASQHSPRVVNILAGGREDSLREDDLALNKPQNFTVANGNAHSTTMLTLTLERFAAEAPRVSFVHQFPGLVATPLFNHISSGFTGFLMRHIAGPLMRLLLRGAGEAGKRSLFTATSARYSVDEGVVPVEGGVKKAERSQGGVFLLNENGESANSEKVLGDLRKRKVDEKVWIHTQEIFSAVE